MYLTFSLYNLQPQDLYYIFAVKQIETEINIPNDTLQRFKDLDLITTIKGKPNQEERLRIRLSSKGKKFLEDLSTPEVTEDSLRIYEWIKNIYLSEGKALGNQKKTKMYIAQFSAESEIKQNCLAYLIKSFTNDESEMEWSKVLQYLFFKGESVFNIRFDLHSSRLYQYYLKYQQKFDKKFEELND